MWFLSRERRRRRLVEKHPIDAALWRETAREVPVLRHLSPDELRALHDLTVVFLHENRVEGCRGFEVDDAVRCSIGAQACLLALGLGIDVLAGVDSVLVYAAGFRARRHQVNELGIVTEGEEDMLGEAWSDGPIVLSWEDVVEGPLEDPAFNLVIHECSHKIDMLTGEEDGVPPLPEDIDREVWQRDFAAARAVLQREHDQGFDTVVDAYAAESPAEGFAVFSETFFGDPLALRQTFPDVYGHLARFYRQDPAARVLRSPAR